MPRLPETLHPNAGNPALLLGRLREGRPVTKDTYENPLTSRYASAEMQKLFSPDTRYRTWRDLWIALARAEKDLGLDISDEQIAELCAARDDIDYDFVAEKEREIRHDVMAHLHDFGRKCPGAMRPELRQHLRDAARLNHHDSINLRR